MPGVRRPAALHQPGGLLRARHRRQDAGDARHLQGGVPAVRGRHHGRRPVAVRTVQEDRGRWRRAAVLRRRQPRPGLGRGARRALVRHVPPRVGAGVLLVRHRPGALHRARQRALPVQRHRRPRVLQSSTPPHLQRRNPRPPAHLAAQRPGARPGGPAAGDQRAHPVRDLHRRHRAETPDRQPG